MGRIVIAFRLLFRALGDSAFAERSRLMLLEGNMPQSAPPAVADGTGAGPTVPRPAAIAPVSRPETARSEAITLLSVLQREARLIDFLKEDIASYDNAQIGAAVRDIHRDAGSVLERLFALQPVMTETEGSAVSVPPGAEAGRLRLIGNVTGQPPYRGTLRHQGWKATRVQVPEWNGSTATANIIAPAEVELR